MNEIERKLSIINNKSRKTRRIIVTIAIVGLLVTTAMLVGASIIASFTYYYEQTSDLDIKSVITITDHHGGKHPAPWSEKVILGTIFPGDTYIYPESGYYIITNNALTAQTVYIHIDVTETLSDGTTPGTGLGLTVVVYDLTAGCSVSDGGQIDLGPADPDGTDSCNFVIHVIVDPLIDASSTYGYTITMDWKNGGG